MQYSWAWAKTHTKHITHPPHYMYTVYTHTPPNPLLSSPHHRSTVLVVQRTLTLPLHSLVHRTGSHLGDTEAGEWTACWNPHDTRDPLPLVEGGMEDAVPRKEYVDFITTLWTSALYWRWHHFWCSMQQLRRVGCVYICISFGMKCV